MTIPEYPRALVWFRRDLRDYDNAALYKALRHARQVFCVFVFDREILDALPGEDRRVAFIHQSVSELQQALTRQGGGLLVRYGYAHDEIVTLANQLRANAVFFNHDDEPAAIARDITVCHSLAQQGIAAHSYKDVVIFERDEILTAAGTPFSVFTPYKNAWLKKITPFYLRAYPVDRYVDRLAAQYTSVPSLQEMGFASPVAAGSPIPPGMSGGAQLIADFLSRIDAYYLSRDFPALEGTSYLSVHLRFGTVSVRHLAAEAFQRSGQGAQTWLSELIWRDFYHQILAHHPEVAAGVCIKTQYQHVRWPNPPGHFEAWKQARTGYPLADAAMRQINKTGYMHNRLRMITASFLTKDLLVDWRWGERYFAEQLLDYDLAANSGGWQWAASVGSDAQPWFRIFNPVSQSERFDPEGEFIRAYLPELARVPMTYIHAPWTMPVSTQRESGCVLGHEYPLPIVDHAQQRLQALALFKQDRVPLQS
ncbi:MAG: cryptochrome/photolyase family protein [Thiobacillus sp.]